MVTVRSEQTPLRGRRTQQQHCGDDDDDDVGTERRRRRWCTPPALTVQRDRLHAAGTDASPTNPDAPTAHRVLPSAAPISAADLYSRRAIDLRRRRRVGYPRDPRVRRTAARGHTGLPARNGRGAARHSVGTPMGWYSPHRAVMLVREGRAPRWIFS